MKRPARKKSLWRFVVNRLTISLLIGSLTGLIAGFFLGKLLALTLLGAITGSVCGMLWGGSHMPNDTYTPVQFPTDGKP